MQDLSHAQWTAAWWAKALAQLIVQAAAGDEAVCVATLLQQFLDANRMSIEDTGKAAFIYDAELWGGIGERCKRKDASCNITTLVTEVSERARFKAKDMAPKSTDSPLASGKGGSKGMLALMCITRVQIGQRPGRLVGVLLLLGKGQEGIGVAE